MGKCTKAWMQTRRPSRSDPGLSCQIMAHNGQQCSLIPPVANRTTASLHCTVLSDAAANTNINLLDAAE